MKTIEADFFKNNLLFQGDNKEVLTYLLDKGYKNTIDLIYIDPPFATNSSFRHSDERVSTISYSDSDNLAYSDLLVGDEYLSFLEERLMLMRELLSEKGSIYLHIDDKIGHYVKILMDKVFGKENFRNDITRIKCNPKNFNRNAYGNIKDVIYFYSKSKSPIWNRPTEKYTEEDISRLFPKVDKIGRRYTTNPLHAPNETKNGATGKEWRGMLPPKGRHWRYPPSELENLDKAGLIEWSRNGNPRKIIFADEMAKKGKYVQDVWYFKDSVRPKYPTEKNMKMLERIIKTSSNLDSIVLDCFCGGGGTLYVAEKLGRKWIGVDQSDIAIQVTTKRIGGELRLF